MRTPGYRGAAACAASLMSIRQRSSPSIAAPSISSSTAYRNRPSELHPFTQYAASSTSTSASSPPPRNTVASRATDPFSNNASISRRSLLASGQKREPSGMVGSISSIRSSAR
ncbi:hypothetical protein KCU90_g2263, partial [Aureobasidium melanogenum]